MFLEYFKIKFKKPILSQEEKEILNLQIKLNFYFSRFGSIKTLISNHKYEDAYILEKYLLIDMINFILFYEKKFLIHYNSSINDIFLSYNDISDETLKDFIPWGKFKDFFDIEIKDIKKILNFKSNLYSTLKKIETFLKSKKIMFPSFFYWKRIKIQLTFFFFFFLFLTSGFIFYRFNNPAIVPDYTQIFYKQDRLASFSEKNSLKLSLKLDKHWNTYTFNFAEKKNLVGIRFDPINQKNIRFQIKNIQFILNDNKILKDIRFKANRSLPKIFFQPFSFGSGLKIEKDKSKDFIEFLTTNYNPNFIIETNVVEVKNIKITMRITEKNNKFEL